MAESKITRQFLVVRLHNVQFPVVMSWHDYAHEAEESAKKEALSDLENTYVVFGVESAFKATAQVEKQYLAWPERKPAEAAINDLPDPTTVNLAAISDFPLPAPESTSPILETIGESIYE